MSKTPFITEEDARILAILSPGSQRGPFAVDVSMDAPWALMRQKQAEA